MYAALLGTVTTGILYEGSDYKGEVKVYPQNPLLLWLYVLYAVVLLEVEPSPLISSILPPLGGFYSHCFCL